jgi:hypothetical protein
MYTTLAIIKKHLNIDTEFTEDDTYILYLYEVAEAVVQRYVCQVLQDLEDTNGDIPKPLVHAILLYIGDLYNSREGNTYGVSVSQVPFTFQFLCEAYRNHADTTSNKFVEDCLNDILTRLSVNGDGELVIQPNEGMLDDARSKALQRIESNFIENGGRIRNLTKI